MWHVPFLPRVTRQTPPRCAASSVRVHCRASSQMGRQGHLPLCSPIWSCGENSSSITGLPNWTPSEDAWQCPVRESGGNSRVQAGAWHLSNAGATLGVFQLPSSSDFAGPSGILHGILDYNAGDRSLACLYQTLFLPVSHSFLYWHGKQEQGTQNLKAYAQDSQALASKESLKTTIETPKKSVQISGRSLWNC